jgi:hypothetical protein
VSNAIGAMLDHIHVLDTRLEQITRLLAERDPRFSRLDMPKLEVPEFENEAAEGGAMPADKTAAGGQS